MSSNAEIWREERYVDPSDVGACLNCKTFGEGDRFTNMCMVRYYIKGIKGEMCSLECAEIVKDQKIISSS